jgi:hypothetical protein
LIGLWETGRNDLQDQATKREFWRIVMPSRNESTHARERLQSAAPVSGDATLLKLQEEAAQFVREARRRYTTAPDELISTVVDAVARDYFRHALRKQRRRVRE